MARQQGRIINTASIAGKRGNAGAAAYCASKFAVIGFTQSFAHEMAPHNVTVNAVCPGILGTAMWLDHSDRSTCRSTWVTIGKQRLPNTPLLSCRLAVRRRLKILAKPWCIWRAPITSPVLP